MSVQTGRGVVSLLSSLTDSRKNKFITFKYNGIEFIRLVLNHKKLIKTQFQFLKGAQNKVGSSIEQHDVPDTGLQANLSLGSLWPLTEHFRGTTRNLRGTRKSTCQCDFLFFFPLYYYRIF